MRTIGNSGIMGVKAGMTDRGCGLLVAMLVCVAGTTLSGCGADSFIDPSTVGRWKPTPTIVPILERLSVIEDEPTEFVQTSGIVSSDLIPEVDQYRLSPGDLVELRIQDYFFIGKEESFERQVDQRGYIDIPRLGSIRAQGRTSGEFTTAVEQAIIDHQINNRPVVGLNIKTQRKQTFSVLGAVQNPGTYFIPSPDYRLLEGLTSAGSFNETLPYIYIVRQVPLSDAAMGKSSEPEPSKKPRGDGKPAAPAGEAPKSGEKLIDLIDDLTKTKKDQPKSPGAVAESSAAAPVRAGAAEPPAIDLPDANRPVTPAPGGGGWVYVDGKWIKAGIDDQTGVPQNVVTQRVIKVPTGPLLAGAADVNIVLRPGDVIRAPVPRSGNVYIAGQVGRPGVYAIPTDGKFTLMRAITAASGLGSIAIPEKCDITRMVGHDRQATICVNYRAIEAGTQPDIYLKPDDRINIGTNFWAQPLAIIRNGFRASYGFGFILDRNFQGEVFGQDQAIRTQ